MSSIRLFISTIVLLGYLILSIVSFNHFHEHHDSDSDVIDHPVDNSTCAMCLAITVDRSSPPANIHAHEDIFWNTSNVEFSSSLNLERKINQQARFRLAPKTSPPIVSERSN